MNQKLRIALAVFTVLIPNASFALFIQSGPSLTLGIPHALNLAYDGRLTPEYSAGLSLGGLNVPLQNGITLGISNAELRGRWHPWGGSLFVGAMLGGQTIYGKGSRSITVTPVYSPMINAEAKVTGAYLTPHFGWLWIFGSGFTLGFELGLQLPLSSKTTITTSSKDPLAAEFMTVIQASPEYQKLESDIEEGANKIGKLKIPYSAFRIGWMF